MSTNATALTELLINERGAMLRFLNRYFDPPTSEDTYQNMYFKVSAVPGDPPILDSLGYLYRLAWHLAVDQMRRQQRQRKLLESAEQIMRNGLNAEPDTAHVVIARSDLERIAKAAASLPEPARTIFNLNRFGGMTQAQISQHLGLSMNTVEKYIRRALDHLIDVRDEGA